MSRIDHEKRNRQEKVWKHDRQAHSVLGSNRPAKRREKKRKSPKRLLRSQYPGTCAVCKKPYEKDEWVWYDHTKEPGRKVAHRSCWKPK